MSYYLHTLTTEKELAVFLIFKKRANLIFKKTVNIHRLSVEGKTDKSTIIFFLRFGLAASRPLANFKIQNEDFEEAITTEIEFLVVLAAWTAKANHGRRLVDRKHIRQLSVF